MLDGIFSTIYTNGTTTITFLIMGAISLALGLLIAWSYRRDENASASMSGALALLPFMVQIVILLVNGNLGAGVAVAGAFSLVRFRSAPGTAQDIAAIFLAMTVGLACAMGYIAVAVFAAVVVCAIYLLRIYAGKRKQSVERELRITIPENLDYTEIFDDVFQRYTCSVKLERVKTANLGSLYNLCYHVRLIDVREEKKFLDHLRCRNGNLEIVCGRVPAREFL